MPKVHVVAPGEHLAAIATREGFGSVEPILQHGDNSALAGRPHPAILDPEEQVTIPDLAIKAFPVATGKRHKFVIKRLAVKLTVTMVTFRGTPTAATEAEVTASEEGPEPASLSGGKLEVPLSDPARPEAIVQVASAGEGLPDLRWELQLGGLGRSETDTGALARLRNLGYYRTVSADAEEREQRSAIEEFQKDQAMALTGRLDDATRAKIAEIHGC